MDFNKNSSPKQNTQLPRGTPNYKENTKLPRRTPNYKGAHPTIKGKKWYDAPSQWTRSTTHEPNMQIVVDVYFCIHLHHITETDLDFKSVHENGIDRILHGGL